MLRAASDAMLSSLRPSRRAALLLVAAALAALAAALALGAGGRRAAALRAAPWAALAPPAAADVAAWYAGGVNNSADAPPTPRVALLFISRGALPHAATWERWLASAADAVPAAAVAAACASQRVPRACAPPPLGRPRSRLFSIYIHAPPDADAAALAFGPGSPFRGRLLPQKERVAAEWGGFGLVEAERALLRAALADPRNLRFLLLSESDVPLRDPFTLYHQLFEVGGGRSRINACATPAGEDPGGQNPWRRPAALGAAAPPEAWRKSAMWWALTRKHAALAVEDGPVYQGFRAHCAGGCIADEHFIPTLVAVAGLEGEAECRGWGASATRWAEGGFMHPESFPPEAVGGELFWALRGGDDAAAESRAARAAAAAAFVDCRAPCARAPPRHGRYAPVLYNVTARKFSPESAAAVLATLDDAELGLLAPRVGAEVV
jgi:hypothetical protein